MARSRLTDRVAAELKGSVVRGVYAPGARLPTIRELAERLGVTRLTVREALAQLETAGFIRTRHGSGTYVVDPEENASLAMLAETLVAGRAMTRGEIESLLAFREVLVTGFIDAVSRNIQPAHVVELEAIVVQERAALGRHAELAALDHRFNEVLAVASGNLFYKLLLRSVRQAHLHLGELVFRHAGDGSAVVDTHASIVRALRGSDTAAVRRRIQRYIDAGNRIVADWLRKDRS
jgi:GntR family transcriptional regulator, transcriptional repressor for pyruvate dehydrogenase complex